MVRSSGGMSLLTVVILTLHMEKAIFYTGITSYFGTDYITGVLSEAASRHKRAI